MQHRPADCTKGQIDRNGKRRGDCFDPPPGLKYAFTTMKAIKTLALLCALAGPSFAQQMTYDWRPSTDEAVQLDAGGYHSGSVYKAGPDGGNMHVDIDAQQPVTVEMARVEDWNNAKQHPETIPGLEFRCPRQHVTKETYVCHLPPSTPMFLIIADERTAEVPHGNQDVSHTVIAGLGTILGNSGDARKLVSPNALHIQYYNWVCVENCNPPQFQWIQQVKEKYELTPILKIYGGLTPERDGEQINIKIKSPVPMAVAILPAQVAGQLHEKPDTFESALAASSCQQRGVQSSTFQCSFKAADGPQSLVIVPEPGTNVPSHKKAEVQVLDYKCVANCDTAPAK